MSNQDFSPDDIGFHILDQRLELAVIERLEGEVDPAIFDDDVGEYELSPAATITISKIDDQLVIQMIGTRRAPLSAEFETRYFLTMVAIQVEFLRDSSGAVDRLRFTRSCRETLAHRIG